MGLNIVLVNYNGEKLESISDPKNFLHRALPPADEDSESLLAKIDWYGDTFFNYLQMRRFLAEWDRLSGRAETPEEHELVVGVGRLAARCQKDRGILKFVGD